MDIIQVDIIAQFNVVELYQEFFANINRPCLRQCKGMSIDWNIYEDIVIKQNNNITPIQVFEGDAYSSWYLVCYNNTLYFFVKSAYTKTVRRTTKMEIDELIRCQSPEYFSSTQMDCDDVYTEDDNDERYISDDDFFEVSGGACKKAKR